MFLRDREVSPQTGPLCIRIAKVAWVEDKLRLSHPATEPPCRVLHGPPLGLAHCDYAKAVSDDLGIGQRATVKVLCRPVLCTAIGEVRAGRGSQHTMHNLGRCVFSNIELWEGYNADVIPSMLVRFAPRARASAEIQNDFVFQKPLVLIG